MMTDHELAAALAARLLPRPQHADARDAIAAKLLRRPEVLAQAQQDMDAADAALVREVQIVARATAEATAEAIRQDTPARKVA